MASYGCSFDPFDPATDSTCTLPASPVGTNRLEVQFLPHDFVSWQNSIAIYSVNVTQGHAAVVITDATPQPSVVGQTYTVRVGVTPVAPAVAAPTGTVVVSDGSASCTITLPGDSCDLTGATNGSVSLQATYSGDTQYLGATSARVAHQVADSVSVAILGATPEPSFVGDSYSVAVNVTALPPASAVPSGTVTVGDGTNSCTVTLPGASCSLPSIAPWWVVLTAHYNGDSRYAPGNAPAAIHNIHPAPPTGPKEMCGIDAVMMGDFESPSFVPVDQLRGALLSPGLVSSINGDGTLSVTIAAPTAGVSTPDGAIDVTGTFIGPVNTGITVNGVVGQTYNGQFLVPGVPLNSGANTLNLTATTLPGVTATASVAVTRTGTAGPVTLQVANATGLAPAAFTFTPVIGVLPDNASVQSVALDADGNGTYDFSAASVASLPTVLSYPQPGLYNVALRVVDSNANVYVARRAVLVQDLAAQRGMLCDVYGYLKDRLNAQDAINAAGAYQPLERTQYQSLFTSLAAHMPESVPQLGFITKGLVAPGFAELTLLRDNPDQTRSGYPLRLTQGSDGVWRISEM